MAENDYIRIEVGLEGGQILSTLVTADSADALERALAAGSAGTLTMEGPDGTIQVVIPRVVYAKRFAREGRVGFGN